jgi:2-methylisocitrate lyase-like PEP mutase family enzyme
VHLVLTARAENYLHGRPDLDDTIERLQAYERAGADVLFAPGLSDLQDIRRIVESVTIPVSVLALANVPPVPKLASVGVRRVSLGGAFAFAALGAVVTAADELRQRGTYGYWENARIGAKAARSAFG